MSELVHRTLETNGVRLHVAEQGQGPLVVLVHGMSVPFGGRSLTAPPAPKDSQLFPTLFDDGRTPSFLSESELDYYTQRFTESGFAGPLNFYRNFDRSWQRTAHLPDPKITQPALFLAGERDPVIAFSEKQLERMPKAIPRLWRNVLLPDCGHWVQQEKPAKTNALLLQFLREFPG